VTKSILRERGVWFGPAVWIRGDLTVGLFVDLLDMPVVHNVHPSRKTSENFFDDFS